MEHNLKICIGKKQSVDGIVACRTVSIREKLLKFLLGEKQEVTILVPGNSVKELSICEVAGRN